MPTRHWVFWLGTAGAGACIALGVGSGVAAADADTSGAAGGTDTTSRSADHDAPPSQTTSAARDAGADATESPDAAPATRPDDSEAPRTKRHRLFNLRATAPDDTAELRDRNSRVAEEHSTEPAVAAGEPEAAGTAPKTPSTRAEEVAPEPAAASATVTGVQTGRAKLEIPVNKGLTTRADWYFPTQADGSVSATGVIWLQHGFMGTKSAYSALAESLSQQTNSIVVVPNLPSLPSLRCGGCWINGVPMQQAVAALFLDETSLSSSAAAAGFDGVLPEDFVLTGHSAGGGLAAAAGGYYNTDPANSGNLRGVVMFDGFSFTGVVPDALQRLDDPFVPVYQIAAPPQLGNLFGATTKELVAARPGQFVGVTLARGSHVDSLIGGNRLFDFFAQLATRFSPPGNTAAVYTLANSWINDLYQGLGPTDGTGIYGDPDQYIVMGDTAAVVLAAPPIVDVGSYLGTWYEVGSVKQFFSIGLVNTKAVYSLNPDGSIKVQNSGNYFFNNGPESSIVGAALPVDPANNRLNVRFFGPASANPPGNYWIVDLDPGYQWAIVTDPTGISGFLLSRTPVVSDAFYQELLDRASVKGVKGRITVTRQPFADVTTA